MGNKSLQVKVLLDEEAEKRFEEIKKHYGLSTNTETIRLIIKKEYERLRNEK